MAFLYGELSSLFGMHAMHETENNNNVVFNKHLCQR